MRRAFLLLALLAGASLAAEKKDSTQLKAWTLDDAPSRPRNAGEEPVDPTPANCRGKKPCPKNCYRSYETCTAEAGCRNRHFCAEKGYDAWAGKRPSAPLCGKSPGCPRPPCYRGPSSCAVATNVCTRDIVCREPDYDPAAKAWAEPAKSLNLIHR